MLDGGYVFGIIFGVTVILAVPLIITAFQVSKLEAGYKVIVEWRRKNFPLHWERCYDAPPGANVLKTPSLDIPQEETDEDTPTWKLGRMYWGGKQPIRRRSEAVELT